MVDIKKKWDSVYFGRYIFNFLNHGNVHKSHKLHGRRSHNTTMKCSDIKLTEEMFLINEVNL